MLLPPGFIFMESNKGRRAWPNGLHRKDSRQNSYTKTRRASSESMCRFCWQIYIKPTYVDSTSDGRSVIYDGIFLPVRNWATSLLKELQLCSNKLYLSPLCTETRRADRDIKSEGPDRGEKGGWAVGKDKIEPYWKRDNWKKIRCMMQLFYVNRMRYSSNTSYKWTIIWIHKKYEDISKMYYFKFMVSKWPLALHLSCWI